MLPIQCADIEVEIVTVGIDCPSPAGQLSAGGSSRSSVHAGGRLATRGPGISKLHYCELDIQNQARDLTTGLL